MYLVYRDSRTVGQIEWFASLWRPIEESSIHRHQSISIDGRNEEVDVSLSLNAAQR